MNKNLLIVGLVAMVNLLSAQSNDSKAIEGSSETKAKKIPWQMISSADESIPVSRAYLNRIDTNSKSKQVSKPSPNKQPKLPAKQVKTKASNKPKSKSKQKIYFAPPPVLRDMPEHDTFTRNSQTVVPEERVLIGEPMNAVGDPFRDPFPTEGPGGDENYIKSHEVEPIANPDVKASFPGGEAKFYEYLRNRLVFPARCMDVGISGTVKLRFVVNIQGNISDIKVIEETKSCPEFTQEAIRVIKNSPKWIPAQISGKFVNSWMIIPVSFKLD